MVLQIFCLSFGAVRHDNPVRASDSEHRVLGLHSDKETLFFAERSAPQNLYFASLAIKYFVTYSQLICRHHAFWRSEPHVRQIAMLLFVRPCARNFAFIAI